MDWSPAYRQHVIEAPTSRFAVAVDVTASGSKTYLSFPSYDALLEWYAAQQALRCVNEVLRECAPMCVAFDLEFDEEDARHGHVQWLMSVDMRRPDETFLRPMLRRIRAAFPELRGSPELVSTSHRQDRMSYHVKFPAWTLPTYESRQSFKRALAARCGDLAPCLDDTAYSRNRVMRMLYSCKFGEPERPLVPHERTVAFDIDAVRAHSWSFIPANAKPLTIRLYDSDYDSDTSDGDGAVQTGVKRHRRRGGR